MKKTLLAVGILLIYGIGSGELLACGDKFLVASRGTRYQRAGQARSRASILVYEHAKSTLPKAFERVSGEQTKKAGYRVISVANANELDQALRQGGWDVVLADLADSAAVRDRVQAIGPGAPMLVPVAYGATGTEIAQAKKEYQRVLKGPIKTYAFLEAMDDILALRNKLLKS
jgi:DNA-binding NtrC family response regulator